MTQTETTENAAQMAENWQRIAERSQTVMQAFLERNAGAPAQLGDPSNMFGAFMAMTSQMMSDPAKLMQDQMGLWQSQMKLWQHATERMLGNGDGTDPVVEPKADDRRFRDPAWQENAMFDYIKQSYLLTAQWMQNTVQGC